MGTLGEASGPTGWHHRARARELARGANYAVVGPGTTKEKGRGWLHAEEEREKIGERGRRDWDVEDEGDTWVFVSVYF
jgi:hypothetical protein